LNDHDFLLGIRQQDPAAVQHLVQCYLPSVWRFVYIRANGDRHLAEDVVSEAVLALVQAAANPELELTNPSAWLRSVANHKLLDHFRAAARVQHLIDQATADLPGAEEQEPANRQEALERRTAIRKALDELPELQRLALEWKYLDRLSVREIAGRMGTTEKATESLLFRARREFRDGLQRCGQLDDSGGTVQKRGGIGETGPNAAGATGAEGTTDDIPGIECYEAMTQRRS
jgi:RNA polymerase sigma factor (sigma-70 family)